jgi:hypothetical protein
VNRILLSVYPLHSNDLRKGASDKTSFCGRGAFRIRNVLSALKSKRNGQSPLASEKSYSIAEEDLPFMNCMSDNISTEVLPRAAT